MGILKFLFYTELPYSLLTDVEVHSMIGFVAFAELHRLPVHLYVHFCIRPIYVIVYPRQNMSSVF